MSCLIESDTGRILYRADTCGVTDYPMSVSMRVRPPSYANQCAFCMGDEDALAHQQLTLRDPEENDVLAWSRNPSASGYGVSASSYIINSWQHVGAVFTSDTSRVSYYEGTAGTAETTEVNWDTNMDITLFGGRSYNSVGRSAPFTGAIAECAIWSSVLTADQMTMLSNGISPLLIDPANLVGYWPLINSLEDVVGGRTLVHNGTEPNFTSIAHPVVIQPLGMFTGIETSAVIHQVSGDCAAVASGDIGVLLRPVEFSGDCDGVGDASGLLGYNLPIRGDGRGKSRGSGSLSVLKNLVMSGVAYSAASGSLDAWKARGFVLNETDYRIQMTFDPDKQGIILSRTNVITGTNDNVWYDLRTKGFYPEVYQEDCRATDVLYYAHAHSQYKGMIIAGADGYLRIFDEKATNDTGKNTDEAISSYMYTAPFKMNEEEMEGKFKSLNVYLGGTSLGSESVASDGVSYEVFVGESIEEVYKSIVDGDTPADSGTITNAGRSSRKTVYGRGAYAVIRIFNSTISETWTLNKLNGVIEPAGRIR